MRIGRGPRGFTLLEAMVTVAILTILAGLAWSNVGRQRPRARLATSAAELQSLLHGARQSALSSGHDVVVLVFPEWAGPSGVGRVIVYEDGTSTFFSGAAAVNFDAYDPSVLATGARSRVLGTIELPQGVVVGPPDGMGASTTLPAPLDAIPVTTACSFCGTLPDHRGAVRFDARGRATFYGRNGPPDAAAGGSVSLTAAPDVPGQRTVIVTPATGAATVLAGG